jgi:hypothetical protein
MYLSQARERLAVAEQELADYLPKAARNLAAYQEDVAGWAQAVADLEKAIEAVGAA